MEKYELDDKKLTILKNDGTEEVVSLLKSFIVNDIKKEYVVYTKNEKDESQNITIYIFSVNRSDNSIKLNSIDTEEEWIKVKDVLRELSKNKDLTNSTILNNTLETQLEPKILENDVDKKGKKVKLRLNDYQNLLKNLNSKKEENNINSKEKDDFTDNIEKDINDKFISINNSRQVLQSVKERAQNIQNDAANSEKKLSELSIEDNEMLKKLEETRNRKKIILQQLSNAIKNQESTLAKAKEKYEDIIKKSNNQIELNQNRIVEFQNSINNTVKLIEKEEQEIAQNQELLKALEIDDEEYKSPRVA